jgi:biopolymer transport protein ExbD
MAFGGFNDNGQPGPMADINVTPMVDVMLVLLVIFIITAPLFTHAIKLDLPVAQSSPAP